MDAQAALDRFTALAPLSACRSSDEKAAVIVRAASASTPCRRATLLVFLSSGPWYADARPENGGFRLRDDVGPAQNRFFDALAPNRLEAGFFVPAASAGALADVAAGPLPGNLLVLPLEAAGSWFGALIFEDVEPPASDALGPLVAFAGVAAAILVEKAPAESGRSAYEFERLRRVRAESLERMARALRDTQTLEEVVLVFAVTASQELRATAAVYHIDGPHLTLRAQRSVDPAFTPLKERCPAGELPTLLAGEEIVQSGDLPAMLRSQLFGEGDGVVAALHIDANLWGMVAFSSARGSTEWRDSERRIYFRLLAAHLELAVSAALGFERIAQLARALSESNDFKDDLLAMLAHDFNGPLTVILGYCELLLESGSVETREEIQAVHAQAERLVRLSQEAVALAQTQAGGFSLRFAGVDLRQIVSQSVKAHSRSDDRIRLVAAEEAIPVSLDVARFNHVLDNLLMNALKYSRGEVAVRVSRNGESASIAIADRGIGIPEAELSAIFARFGRASNARRNGISGSGVGLYVTRKIVEVHGGSITVTSKEGEGSTFTVVLPLAEPEK